MITKMAVELATTCQLALVDTLSFLSPDCFQSKEEGKDQIVLIPDLCPLSYFNDALFFHL